MNRKDFERGCFSGDWSEFEEKHEFTPKQRKDLVTLLLELEDMKNDFNRIVEKKERLANLWKFYKGGLVTES